MVTLKPPLEGLVMGFDTGGVVRGYIDMNRVCLDSLEIVVGDEGDDGFNLASVINGFGGEVFLFFAVE